MSVPNDLFYLLPGELPGGDNYCFLGWQRYQVDVLSRARVLLRNEVGTTFWSVSAATPSADKRIYPWLNLNDGRVYNWSFTFGMWISPRPYSFGQLITPGLGITEVQLWSLDGGDGTDPRQTLPDGSANPAYVAPTAVTGAMWMVDHTMDGRFPLGAGQIPYVDPANPSNKITVAAGATTDSAGVSGEYAHVLTQAEGGISLHTHKYGIRDLTASAAAFSVGAPQTVAAYQARYIGGNAPQNPTETTADLETLPPLAADGTPLTTDAFNKMPPFAGCFFIIPTVRQWYTVPG